MEQGKKDKIIKIISVAAILVLIGVTGYFLYRLLPMAVLPLRLRIIGLVVSLFFSGGCGFLLTRGGWKKILGAVMTGLMLVLYLTAAYYLHHADRAVKNIVEKPALEQDAISLFVLDESTFTKIEELEGKSVGIIAVNDRTNTDAALQEMQKGLSFELQLVEYEGMTQLVQALYDKEVEAILLNNAFVTVLMEVPGFEDIQNRLKSLQSVAITQQESQQESEGAQQPSAGENPETFILYVSGIDTYGAVNTKSRSDVNIIMAVNTKTKQVLLVSTPRDYYVPLTISNGVLDKLTHAGIYGVDVSKGTLAMLYDIEIPYYLRVNFTGFTEIIDALGGVDVNSPADFTVEKYRFTKGINHLDGKAALCFARERHSFPSGDRQRGKNQMEVIRAVIQKCQSSAMLTNYKEVMDSLSGTFQTNMESELIAGLVSAQLFDKAEWNIVSYSVDGKGKNDYTYSMPNYAAYVMVPDMATVNKAKELFGKLLNGERLE